MDDILVVLNKYNKQRTITITTVSKHNHKIMYIYVGMYRKQILLAVFKTLKKSQTHTQAYKFETKKYLDIFYRNTTTGYNLLHATTIICT